MKTAQQINIDQIWEQFHKTGDDQFRNLLMEHYRDLVKSTAEWLHRKLPNMIELDDLMSAGMFGLMGAIESFDPARSVKFKTFCWSRIKGSILDELRSMDWTPRLVRARAHQLAKATYLLETQLGRKPTEKEIAEQLNVDMKEFNKIQMDADAGTLVPLDTIHNDDNENGVRTIKVIEDKKSQDPVTVAQRRDLKNLLTTGLTPAERLIIVLYYYEEMTMREIGKTLDLSESRVSQIHSSIIARLKVHMSSREKEFAIK
jgi:RNA polymerase sigma factor for flagellar operon FliA